MKQKILTVILFITLISCKAQDLCVYSQAAWDANNQIWTDSISSIQALNCDSMDYYRNLVIQWQDAYRLLSDTTVRYGNAYLEIHDTIEHNTASLRVINDEAWMNYNLNNGPTYSFWIVKDNDGQRLFQFWVSDSIDNQAYNIMQLDTARLMVNYQYLNRVTR